MPTAPPSPEPSTYSMSWKMSAREGISERYLARWLSRAGGSSVERSLISSSSRHWSKISWASPVNHTAGMPSSSSSVAPNSSGVQLIEPIEDLTGPVLRLNVGPAVDVSPGTWSVGPHQQLKALQQTVIALLSLGGLVDVGREGPGLDAAQDGETQGRYVQRSSTDSVHIKATRTVPGLQVERAVPFASLLVQVPEPAGEFVPVDQDPLGIL